MGGVRRARERLRQALNGLSHRGRLPLERSKQRVRFKGGKRMAEYAKKKGTSCVWNSLLRSNLIKGSENRERMALGEHPYEATQYRLRCSLVWGVVSRKEKHKFQGIRETRKYPSHRTDGFSEKPVRGGIRGDEEMAGCGCHIPDPTRLIGSEGGKH